MSTTDPIDPVTELTWMVVVVAFAAGLTLVGALVLSIRDRQE